MTLKVGDRVVYANRNHGYGEPSPTDPLIGTKFFCEGSVYQVYADAHPFDCYIEWDNGCKNAYLRKDLELVETEIKWEV